MDSLIKVHVEKRPLLLSNCTHIIARSSVTISCSYVTATAIGKKLVRTIVREIVFGGQIIPMIIFTITTFTPFHATCREEYPIPVRTCDSPSMVSFVLYPFPFTIVNKLMPLFCCWNGPRCPPSSRLQHRILNPQCSPFAEEADSKPHCADSGFHHK